MGMGVDIKGSNARQPNSIEIAWMPREQYNSLSPLFAGDRIPPSIIGVLWAIKVPPFVDVRSKSLHNEGTNEGT